MTRCALSIQAEASGIVTDIYSNAELLIGPTCMPDGRSPLQTAVSNLNAGPDGGRPA